MLEEELGVALLRRGPRGVSPTAAGLKAAGVAKRVLSELEELRRSVRKADLEEVEVVRLGVQPFLASEILPAILRRRRWQGRLMVRERPWYRLAEAVLSGEVDAAVTAFAGAPPRGVRLLPLFDLGYAAFSTESRPPSRLGDLVSGPLVLVQDGSEIELRLGEVARQAGGSLAVAFSSEQGISVFEMVAEGLGTGILPECFAARARRRRVRYREVKRGMPRLQVVALVRTGAAFTEGLVALLRGIADAACSLGGRRSRAGAWEAWEREIESDQEAGGSSRRR
jgi:DNA-binding transcriptional LysR family regulator